MNKTYTKYIALTRIHRYNYSILLLQFTSTIAAEA